MALAVAKNDIGIAEKRTKIVEETPKAHSLEVDEEGISISDHHILGLQVPVNERSLCCRQSLCQSGEFDFKFTFKGRL